ncbi:protein LAZ1 [Tanacetum coccineum]
MGDFNVALNMEDTYSSSSVMSSAMCEFKDCVSEIEVMDVTSSGVHYTWIQKPKGGGGIHRKLDRIMSNEEFIDTFLGVYGMFQPYRNSDHSPALDSNPDDQVLREEEGIYVQAFNKAKLDDESFLKQKAKVKWLAVGDSNSAFFHKSFKAMNQRSRIELIMNSENVEISGNLVPDVFVSHYEQFLGTLIDCTNLNVEGLFSKTIPMNIASNMVRPVTNEEIKVAMFDIGDDKAPGLDGYTSVFFKKAWNIIGYDICNAVQDFFYNSQMLKEINHTFLALIPKVATPLRVNDYRPISCCNVIYKCISKILTNRVIEGIKEVVSDNQSAFIPGRRISDNILITQELMHSYHKKKGPPHCAFKINIQKAYDTVDWRLLEHILVQFGFHSTIGRFHRYCEEIQLINVCFADDRFIIARVDVESARVIMDALEEFKMTSGLVPSELSVKYLGVLLILSRLLIRDCKVLIEKVKNRIGDWKNNSLSFAGRLQLCTDISRIT